jgi:phosphoglucomutase
MEIDAMIQNRVNTWLEGDFDQETRNEIRYLLEKDQEEIIDAFYRDLEFGTGGLRGIMGVGTNRMNKYTVGMATMGLANYLKKMFPDKDQIKVAIAHDSRNNSRFFATITANVLVFCGIKVFLFEDLRPTPELSYAIRLLKCESGIVITASHNPKEYNGYKVYWNDGAQLVNPHDTNVITEVLKITSIPQEAFLGNTEMIEIIGEEVDNAYMKELVANVLRPDSIRAKKDLNIVYTPIHGSGITLMPRAFKEIGFTNFNVVEEQKIPDGNFPTVKSPNPEEQAAMAMAMDLARSTNADLVLATDPDADRLGVGVRDHHGELILLNGNQTATLLTYYLLEQWKHNGKLTGSEYMVKTIVTSELLVEMADSYQVEMFDVLTGFKFIAEIIRNLEGKRKFIGGGEESYGFMVSDFIRDKDAISACTMIAEAAAWAATEGKTLFGLLIDIYRKYKFYREGLITITKKGKSGAEEIAAMMEDYRNNPFTSLIGLKVSEIRDYQLKISRNILTGLQKPIDLPGSNVIQFFLEDGSKITVRPSGTEPKIKFYFGVVGKLEDVNDFDRMNAILEKKIKDIITEMNLN